MCRRAECLPTGKESSFIRMGYLAKVRQADRCRAEVLRHMLSRLPRFRRCCYRWLCKGCRTRFGGRSRYPLGFAQLGGGRSSACQTIRSMAFRLLVYHRRSRATPPICGRSVASLRLVHPFQETESQSQSSVLSTDTDKGGNADTQ